MQGLTVAERVAAAPWWRWPIGCAVRTPGCADLLRVVGHQHVQRAPHLRLRVHARGLVELTMRATACAPALDDDATAALLLAALWAHDPEWHTHHDAEGYVAHVDPRRGEWTAGVRGEALALAALACLGENGMAGVWPAIKTRGEP